MDSLIKQVSRKFSSVGQENKQETSSSKDRRIPLQKTLSFKGEKKKAQNWLQRQFSRSVSRDYDSNRQMEQAAAVAAAAYAIKSLEESRVPDQSKISKVPMPFLTSLRSKKEDAPIPEQNMTSEGHHPSLTRLGSRKDFAADTSEGYLPSFTRLGRKKDYAADTSGGIEPSLTKVKSKKEDTSVLMIGPGNGSKRFSGENAVISSVSPDEAKPEKASSPPPMKKTISFADEVVDTRRPKRTPSKVTDPGPSMKKTPSFADDQLLDGGVPKPRLPLIEPDRAATKPDIPPSIRPTSPPAETKRQSSAKPETDETEADAWERAEIAKIREKYDKLDETIESWEHKQKKKARRKLDRGESDLEKRRLKALTKFRNDMESIDQIAGGARAQAEERRRKEELKAKEKANVMRRTGKVPATCFCC